VQVEVNLEPHRGQGQKVGQENLMKITYGVVKSSFLLRGIPVGSDIVDLLLEVDGGDDA
jgi:hypothetical protein